MKRFTAVALAVLCLFALSGIGLVACVVPSATAPTTGTTPAPPDFAPTTAPGTQATPLAGAVGQTPTPPPPAPMEVLVSWTSNTYYMDTDHTQTVALKAGDTVRLVLDTTAKSAVLDGKSPSGDLILTGTVSSPPGGALTDLYARDPDAPSVGLAQFQFKVAKDGNYFIVIHGTGPGAGQGDTATITVEVWR
jgi:hypothetical protein